ncbi:MAG: DNA-binding protein [Bacteroidales bacterium]|nr:DNA-binding protein [Bacteroidales bacterium]
MKTRYFFITLCAALLTFLAGCTGDNAIQGYLDSFQVSQSYIHFEDMAGGTLTLDVTANDDWYVTESDVPSWLTISPMSGSAGSYKLTLTASEVSGSEEAEIEIRVGTSANDGWKYKDSQFLHVSIGEVVVQEATIAEVLAGSDGTTYLVSGTCYLITGTYYGNFYMEDEDGNSLYVYGTVDSGGSYNWDSFDIEVGDYVTVQGPRSTYGSTVELVDATFISRTKNLISVIDEGEAISKDGGETTVQVKVSGTGWNVNIPSDDRDWLSVVSSSGTDTLSVVFHAVANEGAVRASTVEFTTERSGEVYSTTATITQEGGTVEATADEINNGTDGANYILTGYISSMANTTYGNYYVTDYSGTVYVYGTYDAEGNSKNFSSWGINEGDIICVTGEKTTFNGTVELQNCTVNSFYNVTDVTVAEFNEKESSTEVWYRLTGTVTSISSDSYGNLYLNDGSTTDDLYVYGLYSGWGGGNTSFSDTGIQVGDVITIVSNKDEYKGTIEAANSFWVGTAE